MTLLGITGLLAAVPGPSSPWLGTRSIVLDGIDEYIDLGDVASMEVGDGTTPFSLAMWQTAVGTSTLRLCGKATPAGQRPGWFAYTANTNLRFVIRSSNTSILDVQFPLARGAWRHIAVTYDGSKSAAGVACWVDGVSAAPWVRANTLTGNPDSGGYSAQVGGIYGPSITWHGNIRDFAWFANHVLTPAEVAAIYNGGVLHDLSLLPLPPSPYLEIGATGDDSTTTTGTIQDLVGVAPGTPINTEAIDLVLDVP